jgi:predicted Ser/Thr protein kinase
MSIQQEFPNVHYLSYGATSLVYEVHPRIVVKVRQPGEEAREYFKREIDILKIICSQQTLCPSIVQCYFSNDDSIFLEYMQGQWLTLVEQYQTDLILLVLVIISSFY